MRALTAFLMLLASALASAQIMERGAVATAAPIGGVTYTGNGCAPAQVSAGTSVSCTITGVAAGQSIWVVADGYVGSLVSMALTDTGSHGSIQTWVSPFQWSASSDQVGAYVVVNASSGSHKITLTFGSSVQYIDMVAVVLGGASTASPLDNANGTAPGIGTGGSLTCPNVTTSSNSEFLLAVGSVAGASTALTSGTSPQTMTLAQYSSERQYSEYGTAASAGTNFTSFGSSAASGTAAYCMIAAVH